MVNTNSSDNLTPEERIRIAEAEEIEALRDILKAEARSAAAEATIMENLIEVDQAVGNAVMSLFGQGTLPQEENPIPAWAGALIRKFGAPIAADLIQEGIDFIKDKLFGTGEKQKGRAEEIKQSAKKEAVVKGTTVTEDNNTTTVQPGSSTSRTSESSSSSV